ncbi:hypothetical protein [Gelidibacter japonicus]|uniref:hypothetical protein n=1 Tax=Gelidibacter japonicus TaxID=1962232 RepID=UPI003A8CF7B4
MITKIAYIRRDGDKEIISKILSDLEKFNHQELLKVYGDLVYRGLVGAHGQALYLLAMRIAFLRLFESSPITMEDNCILKINTGRFSIKMRQEPLIKSKAKSDQEMLSQMIDELRKNGEIKSEEVKRWWNSRY